MNHLRKMGSSYEIQSTDMHCKSTDQFLHDSDIDLNGIINMLYAKIPEGPINW